MQEHVDYREISKFSNFISFIIREKLQKMFSVMKGAHKKEIHLLCSSLSLLEVQRVLPEILRVLESLRGPTKLFPFRGTMT